LAAIGLRSTAMGGALLRRAALSRVPTGRRSLAHLGRELDQAGARWDGRLSVSAVELETGRRVMFGTPGAPEASVGTAVEASCAIPGVFRPIPVDGRRYVDGGAWSPTNMDRAPAGRGTRVLCLNPTGSMRVSVTSPMGALGLASRSLAGVEALALQRRGAKVRTVPPDAASAAAMGSNLMDARPRSSVIAAGLAQGRALTRG
jgi:NTE family protein